MAKEKVRHLAGVFASVFAHNGHISKQEAQEISGMTDEEFDTAYGHAATIAEKMNQAGARKMDAFLDHLGKQIEAWYPDL